MRTKSRREERNVGGAIWGRSREGEKCGKIGRQWSLLLKRRIWHSETKCDGGTNWADKRAIGWCQQSQVQMCGNMGTDRAAELS